VSFYTEIKRRGVLRASIAYTVFMWLLIQVADILLSAFDAPAMIMQALIILSLAGFPVTLILAWIFDLTPQGVQKTGTDTLTAAPTIVPEKSLNYTIIGFLTAAVILFTLDKFFWQTDLDIAGQKHTTLAVLPFQNLSGNKANEPFTSGVHDDLLTQLSKIRAFRTISRTSVLQYQGPSQAIPEIARKLGATAVLEGGVQRSEDRVRINAQLVEAKSDTHLWAETYDRQLTAANIFTIQSDISKAIAIALEMTLSPTEKAILERIPTTNLAAYDAYTAARASMDSTASSDLEDAVLSYRQATRLDPDFAEAWAGLCEAHLSQYRKSSETALFESAESACKQALNLDDTRVEVHVALASLYRTYGDYSRAESSLQQAQLTKAEHSLEQALGLDDRLIDARIELGMVYASQGRTKEAEAVLLATAKDHPGEWSVQNALYSFYYSYSDQPGHYESAAHHAGAVTQLRPDLASAWNNLGSAKYMMHDYEEAASAWKKSVQIEPNRTGYTNSGLAYYNSGQFKKAARMQQKATELAPNDHRVWGRLAEALRHGGGNSDLVHEYYQKAAELASEQMQINDQDWRTLQMQALYMAHTGESVQATALADKALTLSERRPVSLYFAALTYLEFGDVNTCLELLRETISKDESFRQLVETDPDLKNISALEQL
jgi:TolB-like protein/Flp pilus assembly protein TadD